MFILRRIFPGGRCAAHYISTGGARNCDKPNEESPSSLLKEADGKDRRGRKTKELGYPEKVVSREEKQNIRSSLSQLLESISVGGDQKDENKHTDGEDILKVEFKKKKSQKQHKLNLAELLYEAADTVAANLGGDIKKTKGDLLQQLKMIEITKVPEVPEEFPNYQLPTQPEVKHTAKILEQVLSSKRLMLFNKYSQPEVKLNIWDRLEEEELAYLALSPPRNQLEEWIQWTEQGKLWQFPIDNDQGMEREAQIDFTQHVFLEEHLDPWCPKKGPIKKFMDLVLVGLSKNPYLTVEEKKDHIFWYRDYFENKKKLLQELGAFGTKEIGEPASSRPKEEPR